MIFDMEGRIGIGSSGSQGESPKKEVVLPTEEADPSKQLTVSDNVGLPNYPALTEEARQREVKASMQPLPNRADFFLREEALDYPLGYREPGSFEIEGADEWEKFSRRRISVEKRMEEALRGTF